MQPASDYLVASNGVTYLRLVKLHNGGMGLAGTQPQTQINTIYYSHTNKNLFIRAMGHLHHAEYFHQILLPPHHPL